MSFVIQVEKAKDLGSDDSCSPRCASPASSSAAVEQLHFVVGNPRVMVTSGVLHLFRTAGRSLGNVAIDPANAGVGTEAIAAKSARSSTHLAMEPMEPAELEDDRLPRERGTQVCCIAVPSHFSVSDFVAFTGSFVENIKAIRILRDTKPYCYMALVSFAETDEGQHHADAFFLEYQGKLFNTMEERERCKLVFVAKVEIEGEGDMNPLPATDAAVRSGSGPAPDAGVKQIAGAGTDAKMDVSGPECGFSASNSGGGNSGMTFEIPRCPVCLDRLDPSATGVLTTVCNHTFHCSCLRGWADSSCPVCRYVQTTGDIASSCQMCEATEDLWMCLICGHIGCGRYTGEHAKRHHAESGHTYALELETQRVWDYAGDGYVHRLITNQQDGKIVEFPNARDVAQRRRYGGLAAFGGRRTHIEDGEHGNSGNDGNSTRSAGASLLAMERSQLPPAHTLDAEARFLDREAGAEKVDSITLQYSVLLTSQLEEQRNYFEDRISTMERRAEAAAKKRAASADSKAAAVASKLRELEKENALLRDLNKSLVANQVEWRDKIKSLEVAKVQSETALKAQVADLQAQVHDLMFYLDTQKKVEDTDPKHKHELREGIVLVADGGATCEGGRGKRGTKTKQTKKKGRK